VRNVSNELLISRVGGLWPFTAGYRHSPVAVRGRHSVRSGASTSLPAPRTSNATTEQLRVLGYIAMPCRPVPTEGPAMKVVFDSGVSRTAGQSHPL